MPNTQSQRRWEPSAEVRAAAKSRLPLKLPRPEETRLRELNDSFPEARLETRPTSLHAERPHQRLKSRQVEWPVSDEDLESRTRQVLLQSGISGFVRLQVEVRGRVAVLRGALPTDFERQLAVHLVRRVNGLDRVDHEISVRESVNQGVQQKPEYVRVRRWLTVLGTGVILLAFIGLVWALSS
jgi:hypothetical protein